MDGELRQVDGGWELRFTRRLPHPPAKVWRALTEPDELQAWFPTTIEGEREAGAALTFRFPMEGAPPMHGEMLACEPPSLLELRWGDGDVLRFELRPDGGGTVLTLRNTFAEHGKAARDAAGWHACLDVLGYRLDGQEPPWGPGERWSQVHPGYVTALGPEAAAIGPPDWA
jgi:uncharacterized protein YndB with AHSA1/START domain